MRSKGEAIRGLMSILGDQNSQIAKYPQDFILFQIGEYDDETGAIMSHAPESLGVASEFERPEPKVATPNGHLDPKFDDGIERN